MLSPCFHPVPHDASYYPTRRKRFQRTGSRPPLRLAPLCPTLTNNRLFSKTYLAITKTQELQECHPED
jgi:hypothetical protein